jgi:ferredoxin-type protein NapG
MEEAEMGLAVVDERLCVSLNGTGVCGACHTICPLRNRAITLDIRNAPKVHEDECVGCGLCEEVCIVREPRAIYVRTDRLGKNAEKVEKA